MESLGYVLMYLINGKLPWQGLGGNRRQNSERVLERRLEVDTPIDALCSGAPSEFATYLKYCKYLKFEEKPDLKLFETTFSECPSKAT